MVSCATNLCRRRLQRRPVDAGQHIDDELGVDIDVVLHQLGIFGVQGERVRGALARLHRTGKEVECEYFHIGSWRNSLVLVTGREILTDT